MHKNDEHLIYSAVEETIKENIRKTVEEKLKHETVQSIINSAINDYFDNDVFSSLVKELLNYEASLRDLLIEKITEQVETISLEVRPKSISKYNKE